MAACQIGFQIAANIAHSKFMAKSLKNLYENKYIEEIPFNQCILKCNELCKQKANRSDLVNHLPPLIMATFLVNFFTLF